MRSPFNGPSAAETSRPDRRPASLFACVIAVGLAVGGCASSNDERYAAGGPTEQQIAQMPVPARPHVVEMEDDGLPVQTAPLRRPQPQPDDPTEPWSPNYGSVPLPRAGDGAPVDSLRPTGPAQQVNVRPIDAEAVIAQAIIEHERRQP